MFNNLKNVRIYALGKLLIPIALGLIISTSIAMAQTTPPGSIAYKYNSSIDWSVSDDFSSINWSKWCYRKDNGSNGIGEGSQYAYIVNNSFLSLKGSGSAKKGGGLSALRTASFGFYITKFRFRSFPDHNSTVWHPSIWSSPWNMGTNAKHVSNGNGGNWLEIDFMEYLGNHWHIQLAPRKNNVLANPRPVMMTRSTGNNNWVTLGLEYNKDGYIQAWEGVNGSWVKRGPKIWYSSYENSASKVYYKCKGPQYWILSNKYHQPWGYHKGDSWMHVDFFYYYPTKGLKSADGESLVNESSKSVSLYPNPTSGELYISGLESGAYSVNVYNIQGKLVLNTDINAFAGNSKLNVHDLSNGIYIMKIKNDELTKTIRFVKD